MDKLAPHAYGISLKSSSSHNRNPVDIIFQRSVLISLATSLPILLIWLNCETILLALGQDAIISRQTATFVGWMMFSIIPALVFESMKKWRQAQGDFNTGLYTLGCGLVFNICLNALFTLGRAELMPLEKLATVNHASRLTADSTMSLSSSIYKIPCIRLLPDCNFYNLSCSPFHHVCPNSK